MTSTPPGEGERRAQRGYVRQYQAAAAAIYDALDRDELIWVGLADRRAGIADDVVLGFRDRVVGHQFKTSKFAGRFLLKTLFFGAGGLFGPLVQAWKQLSTDFPTQFVELRLVTTDYPSNDDALIDGAEGHSAAFLRDLDVRQQHDLAGLRASKWALWIDHLEAKSGLSKEAFEAFLTGLRVFWGPRADFLHVYRLTPSAAEQAQKIASLLPRLVADQRDRDRWARQDLLAELGWRDTFALRRPHQFPIGLHVQRNVSTEQNLNRALRRVSGGYIALVGPPGSGKSTTLQSAIASSPDVAVVRYLAFMPGEGQGIGRAEAEDFLDDINGQLKQTGLSGLRFQAVTQQHRREEFEALLKAAGRRFATDGKQTLVVVDGLDHIPREETPDRSLLAELPLPIAVPDGVTFILGTQRLDLAALKPKVQDQASASGRRINISPLSRDAIDRMAEALGLDKAIDRGRIADIGAGHPLATRYLIEALRAAPEPRQRALLDGEFTFYGDIEAVYAGAWRDIGADVKMVIAYIARAEGQMPPELLAKAVTDDGVERTLASVGHLLEIGANGWTVFHNSFRLFILGKPRLKFGKIDPEFDDEIYARLADLSLTAAAPSPQRWLELRYRSRASQHSAVLTLATAERFRTQLAEGRPDTEILIDLRMAFRATGIAKSANELFRLLLARDEIQRRSQALDYAPILVDALLAVGDFDGARAYALAREKGGFKIVDALLETGDIDGARALFDRIEPTAAPTGAYAHDPTGHQNQVEEWTSRVFHFREVDQILDAITRFAAASKANRGHEESLEEYADSLRFSVARAAIADASNDADNAAIAASLEVAEGYIPYLLLQAADRALERGDSARADRLFRELTEHPSFLGISNGYRRDVALAFSMLGNREAARSVFAALQAPGVVAMKSTTGDDAALQISSAMAKHSELAAFLGEDPGFPKAEGVVLTPLQNHLAVAGALLGRARAGEGIASGEVARAAKAALTYLEHAKAPGSSEFYAMHQLAAAAPTLAATLIPASWRVGEAEFKAVLDEFEQAFSRRGQNATRLNIRRTVALEAFFCDGNQAAAARRLEPIVATLQEQTPAQQVDLLAILAIAFSRIGASERARELIAHVHDHTLGYATAAKKDPQYALWRDLMVNANAADPENRRTRVMTLVRVVRGMMDTEGRDSGYRIAAELLIEAATCDAALGLATAKALAEAGALSWDSLVNALMLGTIRRKPELAAACAVIWARVALPYYSEPRYRPDALGDLITEAVASAPAGDLLNVVNLLQASIESDSRPEVRTQLIGSLCEAAGLRDVATTSMAEADARWRAETPPNRDYYTPGTYDAVTSLADLEVAFEASAAAAEDGKPAYDGTSAYTRLLDGKPDLTLAKAMFERWPLLQEDSHSRFALVGVAIAAGDLDLARTLTAAYVQRDDPWGSWSRWYGGGRLRYFRACVAIEGAKARVEAFADLCGSLAAGKEAAGNLLVDFDTVFPLIVDHPDWVVMWDSLAEQLQVTREYKLGAPLLEPDPMADTDLLIALLRWAVGLSQRELLRGARMAVRDLAHLEGGEALLTDICGNFLQGDDDDPLFAVQILSEGNFGLGRKRLAGAVRAVYQGTDFAAALFAKRILAGWGEPVDFVPAPLPAFYSLAFDDADDHADGRILAAQKVDAVSLDPLGWTQPFGSLIGHLARGAVTPAHIRRRCALLIDSWGGSAAARQQNDNLMAELTRLDLRLTYIKPSGVVAMRGLRRVIGEMRLAGLIGERELEHLVRKLTAPALGELDLPPAPRPVGLARPPVNRLEFQTGEATWLDGVSDDLDPFEVGGMFVLAEIYKFTRHDIRRELVLERIRVPYALNDGDFIEESLDTIPDSIWIDGVRPLTDEPAPTIVRTLQHSELGGTPEFLLTICPFWLQRLSWRRHPENRSVFLDTTGRRVVQLIWWRDGVPQDVREHGFWSDGVLVTVTAEGRRQIEAANGPLTIVARATRSYREDEGLRWRTAERRYN
ncbi:ATP-binding protein [Rhizobium leguminosarum]|uniref:ATP-binding protein n=1 Tax=Rhizobium leguminosarum TaxID=384 RepID=UPI0014428F82|nr:ATP-binding protein [Rhizobium leguminosarum]NKL76337.1 ATP-binding protein [Rhizobium leguminosarum bv. viciae]